MADYSQAQLDAMAQKMGFQNYSQWAAWNARRQQQMAPQHVAPAPAPVQPAAPAPKNWLQTLIENYTPLGWSMNKAGSAMRRK